MSSICASTSCLACIVVALAITATYRYYVLRAQLRPSATDTELIADATPVAARKLTPLVRLTGYVSEATTNGYVNCFAFYRKFDSEGA